MDQIDYLIGELGLHVFPLRPDTKQPYAGSWYDYTTNSPTDARAMHAGIKTIKSFSKTLNREVEPDFTGCIWGVNMGASNKCAVDIDVGWHEKQKRQKEGFKNFEALKAKHGYPKTFTVRTPSGGFHIITEGKCKSNNSVVAKDIDIKSDGAYIVAPGTVTSKGKYEVIHDVPFEPTPKWLLDLQGQRQERTEILAVVGKEMTDAQRQEIESALEHIPCEEYDTIVKRVGMAIHHEYPGPDGLEVWDNWCRGLGEAYSSTLCASKWSTFGHSSEDGKDITIATLFKTAREYDWQGYSQDAAQAFTDALPTPTYAEQLHQALEAGNPTLPAEVRELDLISSVVTMREVMAMPPHIPDPVVDNLFEPGDKFCIIGKSKTRKTYFMFNMACCIAAGNTNFLGLNVTKPRRVIVIQYEVKDGHFFNRARSVAKALKLDETVMLDNLHVLNLKGKQWNWPAIHKMIRHFGAEVVIFDPIYKMFEGDENAAEGWRLLLGQYDRICVETGAAVGYVHHDAKGKAGDRDIADRGSGSGMLARDYDAGMTLTPHADFDNATVVEFLTRNFREPDKVTATWNDFPAVIADPNLEARAKCSASMDKSVRKPITDKLWSLLAERYSRGVSVSADKMAKDTVESAEFMSLSPDDKLGYKTLRDRLVDLIRFDHVVGYGSESVVFSGFVDESTGKAVAHVKTGKLGERL